VVSYRVTDWLSIGRGMGVVGGFFSSQSPIHRTPFRVDSRGPRKHTRGQPPEPGSFGERVGRRMPSFPHAGAERARLEPEDRGGVPLPVDPPAAPLKHAQDVLPLDLLGAIRGRARGGGHRRFVYHLLAQIAERQGNVLQPS
jgi:hypothetical protein